MHAWFITSAAAAFALGASTVPALPQDRQTRAMSDARIIKSAMSAAPRAIARGAAIVVVETDNRIRTVRKGTNGFACMPDNPATPGPDPMCTDPYARKPEAGNNWVKTGAHVMVVGAKGMMAGYPRSPKLDVSQPYVMWPDTPYERLMIPVR